MPPKAKFTKEEVISAALKMVKENGIEVLTARALGEKLGSSARPIFTLFNGMEEIKDGVIKAASALYDGYIAEGLTQTPAFKGVGTAYIRFAVEQPKLFMLLFMREQTSVPDKNSVLGLIDNNVNEILNSIVQGYGLDLPLAKSLYLHSWIYSHGIAVLLATKVCSFSAEEISNMLTEVVASLIKKIKAEGKL